MVFNTNKNYAMAPITLICATEYSGGELGDKNPLLLAYNGIHYESLETITQRDENRAIELAQLIKSNKYELDNSHIQSMAKISQNRNERPKEVKITNKGREGEHGQNKYKHKCEVCKCRTI